MANIVSYPELVRDTYCQNAIRSVMLIDDNFITYSQSIEHLNEKSEPELIKLDASKRAANLERFFQNKRMLCDIDNGVDKLDIDRIRKSDLIIIDYHLEDKNPLKTINIIDALRNSKQLNIVIVYTQADLKEAWMQTLASLKGNNCASKIIDSCNEYDVTDFWENTALPEINGNGPLSLTFDEIKYFIETNDTRKAKKNLFTHPEFIKNKAVFQPYLNQLALAICEEHVLKYNIASSIPTQTSIASLISEDCMWIKSGNIFVTFFHKGDTEDDSEDIWDCLINALSNWSPSYYNIIKSEIQNEIISDSLSFKVHLENDLHGQAAWLNEIIKLDGQKERRDLINIIYKNISDEIYTNLKDNHNLNRFINDTFDYYHNKFNSQPIDENSISTKRATYCANEMGIPSSHNLINDMYHALNMSLSSKNYREKYISTGTVLKCENDGEWYLCVSAACDMVPSQGNDLYHEKLHPHRLVKIIKLYKVNADTANKQATQSRFIFAIENGSRMYFSVTHPITSIPLIDYIILRNHKTVNGERIIYATTFKTVTQLNNAITQKVLVFKLKSQLRHGYAERYQHVANSYSGRIGVDYINTL
ncbi:hypothetical protein G4923_05760 [Aeromonas rivipollensis]|uniref:Response receiver domain-containing protein n=1 Tax=Aeromonas rivipollensis TaxID=948519 RepID=A0ABX0CWR2_9GAMM|nr:response regulator receiver domain [Aeromonas rivipollensis]NEX88217.1 hypothetical protein [Aeromonas rivipollensis]NEY07032.1 hypothetical protein [Aeromonas rivipollensis]